MNFPLKDTILLKQLRFINSLLLFQLKGYFREWGHYRQTIHPQVFIGLKSILGTFIPKFWQ